MSTNGWISLCSDSKRQYQQMLCFFYHYTSIIYLFKMNVGLLLKNNLILRICYNKMFGKNFRILQNLYVVKSCLLKNLFLLFLSIKYHLNPLFSLHFLLHLKVKVIVRENIVQAFSLIYLSLILMLENKIFQLAIKENYVLKILSL